jgi:Ca2+-binding EF-hand superfamily protein
MIKEIDASHNGYVTSTELDDIFKIIYKEDLNNKDISHIIRKYSSIQNRILIDYKKFKESMIA